MFTFNDPPADWTPTVLPDGVRYLVGQYERGDGTGRLHFQGYCVLDSPCRLVGAKRLLNAPTGHFEVRRGSHEQAREYCLKESTREPGRDPIELGTPPPGAGARTDLESIKGTLQAGGSLLEVADANFGAFLRYHRALERYQGLLGRPRNSPPEVYYYWGAAGSGKTREVYSGFDDPSELYAAPLSPNGGAVWFDGYVNTHHTAILLDDYYHNYKLTFFLQLLDRYPLKLPVKGGFVDIGNVTIYITSNIPLEEQYPNAPDQNAIRRRVTKVVHFSNLQPNV